METRDQWYKPNLLYNIHYRPPKKPEPPKMIVETVQFNPSVCTCGEHDCQPQYRMEKRVIWTNKEVGNSQQQSKVKEGNKIGERKESKFEESIIKQNRKITHTESKQISLKEETDQECCYEESGDSQQMRSTKEIGQTFIEGGSNKCEATDNFNDRMSGEFGVRASYQVEVKENSDVEDNDDDDDDDDNDDDKKEKREERSCKDELGCSDSKDDICIDEGASNTSKIKENNSNVRSDRDSSEGRNSEMVYGEKIIGTDPESDCIRDCKGRVKCSKEDRIDKKQTTGESIGADDSDSAGDDAEYCSKNRILRNDFDKIAESCSLEDDGLEDVEIASAFGIMTIYCNSELHSWRRFKGEDAQK